MSGVGKSEMDEQLADYAERVARNTAPPEIDPATGLRADGAECPEDCGCIKCEHRRYGCVVCGNTGPECTPLTCKDDEGDDNG